MQQTNNEIYFASMSPSPLLGKIECKLPKALKDAIVLIPEIAQRLPSIGDRKITADDIFVALGGGDLACEIYEDTKDPNRTFYKKIAENAEACVLESLESKNSWAIMAKGESKYQKISGTSI